MGQALVDRIDAAILELQAIRAELAELLPAPAPSSNGQDTSADFAEPNMVSVQAAAERWNVPEDTLRNWLRHEQGLGIKSGNVWRVSIPAFRRRLERRGE